MMKTKFVFDTDRVLGPNRGGEIPLLAKIDELKIALDDKDRKLDELFRENAKLKAMLQRGNNAAPLPAL